MTRSNAGPAAFSFWCGLTSLSLEILWVRLVSFAYQTTPRAFGFVLCAFLAGVAFGAAAGRRQCVRDATEPARLWVAMAWCLLLSGLAAMGLPIAYSAFQESVFALHAAFFAIVLTSFVLAFCFPIAHHLGAQGGARQGRHFAAVYTSNVAGSALGPLLVGYVLLDNITVQRAFQLVGLLQLCAGLATWWIVTRRSPPPMAAVVRIGVVFLAGVAAAAAMPRDEHWLVQRLGTSTTEAKTVIENRHGVIALVEGGKGGDVVYGSNAYDGRTNTDLFLNSNSLHRLTIMPVLRPQPRRVLMIGMSIGSWLNVVLRFPGVESVDVIEINPGYVEAAQLYAPQREALADPRVHLHIDDGRRWLRLNPAARYDMVVMNTTYHFRSNSTLLLSSEFLSTLRARLTPGGVVCFNATGSLDALYTASRVFAHAYRYDNFVYAADFDFRPLKDAPEALAAHRRLYYVQAAPTPQHEKQLQQWLARPFVDYESDRKAAGRDGELITDENMVPEFRRGRPI